MPTLQFRGKQIVYAHHLTVPTRMLKPVAAKGVSPGKKSADPLDDNLIIHGDNLEALKALMPRYAGRVNCIYIDPPYNTGNEGWVYNDNVNDPNLREWLKDKAPVDGEDLERHDKWLCMMWPRLHLLRDLLAEDGVIFVSIDDNEQHHLRMVMDEIFGHHSYVGMIAWESKTKNQNTKSSYDMLQPKVEYILCYSKQEKARFNLVKSGERAYLEKDKKGAFRYAEIGQMSHDGIRSRASLVFPILDVLPKKGNQWKIGKDTVNQFEQRGDLVKKGGKLYLKMRPSDERTEKTDPFWAFFSKEIGTAENAKRDLSAILGRDHGLETVKPMEMVKRLIFHASKSDGIILDSFAGSGTTAHATLALNKEGGNRKFILVERENYAEKVTAERVKRVIKGYKNGDATAKIPGLGGSFAYCTLGDIIAPKQMLVGKNLPDYNSLARHLVYMATGKAPDKIQTSGKDGFFHEDKHSLYYLIYQNKLAFLRSTASALNEDIAERVAKQAQKKRKTAIVYATHKFIEQKDLTPMGITFCNLPYEVYQRTE